MVQLCWAADLTSPTIEAGGIELWPGNKNPAANFVEPAFFDPYTTAYSFGFVAMLAIGMVCGLKPARKFDADGDKIEEPEPLHDKRPVQPVWMTARLLSHLKGRRSIIRLEQEEQDKKPELPSPTGVPTFKPYEPLDELSLHEKVTTRPIPSRGDGDPMYLTERSLSSRVKFFDGQEKKITKRVSVVSPSHRDAQRAADAMYMQEQSPPRPPKPPALTLPEHLQAKPGMPAQDPREARDIRDQINQLAGRAPGELAASRPQFSPQYSLPGTVGSMGISFGGDSFGDTQGSFRDTHGSFRVSRTTTFSGSHGDFRETRSSGFSVSAEEVRAERSVRQQRLPRAATPAESAAGNRSDSGTAPQSRRTDRPPQPALFPDEVV